MHVRTFQRDMQIINMKAHDAICNNYELYRYIIYLIYNTITIILYCNMYHTMTILHTYLFVTMQPGIADMNVFLPFLALSLECAGHHPEQRTWQLSFE